MQNDNLWAESIKSMNIGAWTENGPAWLDMYSQITKPIINFNLQLISMTMGGAINYGDEKTHKKTVDSQTLIINNVANEYMHSMQKITELYFKNLSCMSQDAERIAHMFQTASGLKSVN